MITPFAKPRGFTQFKSALLAAVGLLLLSSVLLLTQRYPAHALCSGVNPPLCDAYFTEGPPPAA